MKKELYERLRGIVETLWDKGELEYIRPYNMMNLREFYNNNIDTLLKNIRFDDFNYSHDYFTVDDLGHIRSFISYKNHIIKHSEEILDMYYYLDDFDKDLYNEMQEELKNRKKVLDF